MRESATWKTMFCVLAAVTALTAVVRAEPSPSTPAQLELLGKVAGVGHIKFGMAPDDFGNGALTPDPHPPDMQPGMKYFTDTDLDGVTWGKLPPDTIQLGFYYDHLVEIRLHFTQSFGDLLAVTHAVCEKYGTPDWSGWMEVDNIPNVQTANWSGIDTNKSQAVNLQLAFPRAVPAGSDENTLAQKTGALMILAAPNLIYELRLTHQKDLEQETLKAHDLEKIKGDL